MRLAPALLALATLAPAADLPLVLDCPMDGNFSNAVATGFEVRSEKGITAVGDGKFGGAWQFNGKGRVVIGHEGYGPQLDLIGSPLAVSLWADIDHLPAAGFQTVLISKRVTFWHGYTFQILVSSDGSVGFSAQNGNDTVGVRAPMPVGRWVHLAITHAPDGDFIAYLDGKEVGHQRLEGTLSGTEDPILLGDEDGTDSEHSRREPLSGKLDDLRIYAAALDAAQVQRVMAGERLPSRPAQPTDVLNRMPATIKLVRFDMALGSKNRDGNYPELTRSPCRRAENADWVDWPALLVGHRVLFRTTSEERVTANRELHQHGGPLFQQPTDTVISPGNHWFRPLSWLWGQSYTYTTDNSSRGSGSAMEIWTFPVIIAGAKPGAVKSAKLTWKGSTIYDRTWDVPRDSLTLCLPQNTPGPHYELSINGGKVVAFDTGLKPVVVGDPREEPVPVALDLGGGITAKNLEVPEYFPFETDWQKQLAGMKLRHPAWRKATTGLDQGGPFTRHLGVEVARSPITTYTVSLTAGMSGGHWLSSVHGPRGAMNNGKLWPGSADDYASWLAKTGYDMVFEMFTDAENGKRTPEALIDAGEQHGVRIGFNLITVGNPNLMYYSTVLPDFWLPKLRDAQLVAQRVHSYPNFAGLTMGADNAGYVPYWDWAPPIPNRPWAEAFLALNGQAKKPEHPIGPALPRNPSKPHEVPGTQKAFIDYIQRYDTSFAQFGKFQERIADVDPQITLTSGSYGSGPGVGASGGWPWASIPGATMFKGLAVTQSYDWDETDAEKPLHNLSLLDRLVSWYPNKPAWALHDDFFLKYGREARQRVIAMSLTRGPAAVGFNWVPQPTGEQASPQTCADEQELWTWVHRTSGAYGGTHPQVPIGILYRNEQAISRPITDGNKAAESLRGSHEGKATEALILCQLAGWPARLVTIEELKRGLPADMKTLLCVGLNRFDDTWLWSDGAETPLKTFAAAGGKFLLDDESVLPSGLTGVSTGMQVHAYNNQGPAGVDGDKVRFFVDRNQANIGLLKQAMADAVKPLVVPTESLVWAVPHRTGDVTYATITNWSYEPGQTSVRHMKPVTAALTWNTTLPIYDVALSKALSPADAAHCDLTKDAMHLYALPPAAPTAPTLAIVPGADGFYTCTVTVLGAGKAMAGVPLELSITGPGGGCTLWGASGTTIRLPVKNTDQVGSYTVAASELLSGLKGSTTITVKAASAAASAAPVVEVAALRRFLARKEPLVIGLTAEQKTDPTMKALADELVKVFAAKGRTARIRDLSPTDLVVGVQTYTAAQPFPKWQTIPVDLVLLGDLTSNILINDQALGEILPPEAYRLQAGQPLVRITNSPFVGNYNCLNILGKDPAALTAAVAAIKH